MILLDQLVNHSPGEENFTIRKIIDDEVIQETPKPIGTIPTIEMSTKHAEHWVLSSPTAMSTTRLVTVGLSCSCYMTRYYMLQCNIVTCYSCFMTRSCLVEHLTSPGTPGRCHNCQLQKIVVGGHLPPPPLS